MSEATKLVKFDLFKYFKYSHLEREGLIEKG